MMTGFDFINSNFSVSGWESLVNEDRIYKQKIEQERQIIEKYHLLKTNKTPSENFNLDMLPFPMQGRRNDGIRDKLLRMICGLDITNENLLRAKVAWEKIHNNADELMIYNSYFYTVHRQMLIYVVHDIKSFVDQILCTTCFLETGGEKIEVDCIGRYLNHPMKYYSAFVEFFRILNGIENSMKHSFLDGFQQRIGKNEVICFSIYLVNNDCKKEAEEKSILLDDLVDNFNRFYVEALDVISQLIKEKETA